jgi:hypothetical protein
VGICSILYPQLFNIDIPEKSCIDDIIIYEYLSSGTSQDELIDIQEVVMSYSPTEAERKITEKSAVQQKLWKIFELEKIDKQLSLHQRFPTS